MREDVTNTDHIGRCWLRHWGGRGSATQGMARKGTERHEDSGGWKRGIKIKKCYFLFLFVFKTDEGNRMNGSKGYKILVSSLNCKYKPHPYTRKPHAYTHSQPTPYTYIHTPSSHTNTSLIHSNPFPSRIGG